MKMYSKKIVDGLVWAIIFLVISVVALFSIVIGTSWIVTVMGWPQYEITTITTEASDFKEGPIEQDIIDSNIVVEEYEDPILPDGIYLYFVNGSYMTLGVMTTGNVQDTDRRAGRVTFYSSLSFGEDVATYEGTFVQNKDNERIFDVIGSEYSIEVLPSGRIEVKSSLEDHDIDLGFEGNYIFLYSFDEFSQTGLGECENAIRHNNDH